MCIQVEDDWQSSVINTTEITLNTNIVQNRSAFDALTTSTEVSSSTIHRKGNTETVSRELGNNIAFKVVTDINSTNLNDTNFNNIVDLYEAIQKQFSELNNKFNRFIAQETITEQIIETIPPSLEKSPIHHATIDTLQELIYLDSFIDDVP